MARERTRFEGVYIRPHSSRRHAGKPDMCYDITYKATNNKKVWEKVGYISEGYTAQVASVVRAERIRNMRHSDIPSVAKRHTLTFSKGFDMFAREWLCHKKSGAEDIRRYRAYLAPALSNMPMTSITALDIERIKSAMLGDGYSPQTVKHALGLVRRVYRKLREWGQYTGIIPTERVIMPRVDADRTRYLTQDEAALLLAELRTRSRTWHDITLLALSTGMRLGEILSLRWEDVDIANYSVHIRDAKAGSRTALLTEDSVAMLKKRGTAKSGLIFPPKGSNTSPESAGQRKASKSFTRAVERLGLNEGISDARHRVVFHSLRHTYASWLAIKGVPIYTIKELLGHKSIEMTERYSHLCPDAKRDAVRLLDSLLPAIHTTSDGIAEYNHG